MMAGLVHGIFQPKESEGFYLAVTGCSGSVERNYGETFSGHRQLSSPGNLGELLSQNRVVRKELIRPPRIKAMFMPV